MALNKSHVFSSTENKAYKGKDIYRSKAKIKQPNPYQSNLRTPHLKKLIKLNIEGL